MTERKPTNVNIIIQTNNSYDITYGLKNYGQKDVWSLQVVEKSVYAVWDYNIVMQWTMDVMPCKIVCSQCRPSTMMQLV